MYKKGFSLLELMIVIAFIGIMTSVTIVSLNSSRTKKQVEDTAREVAAAIREAQNGALTGKKTDATHLPCNYYFTRVSDSAYSLSYQYHTGSTSNCATGPFPANQTLATYVTQNGVSVNSFNTITFQVPFANISGLVPVNLMPIIVNKGSVNYAVCVSSSGNVWEKPNSTNCDP